MNRVAIVGHDLDLLQHLGFSHNNTTAVAVLQNRKKKITSHVRSKTGTH